MLTLSITSTTREALIDITPNVEALVRREGLFSGAILLYSPHTTSGLTINEGADPDVCRDILHHLRAMIPKDSDFRHAEGNSDAHIKALLLGSSVHILLRQGKPTLGRWQRIFLGEFDGPRTRTLWLQPLA